MKRKSLLFLLLMAMFAPLAMNGQGAIKANRPLQFNPERGLLEMNGTNGTMNRGDRETTYELVTASQTDWSGNYVLVGPWNSTTGYAFDGEVNSYQGGITAVTIDGNSLSSIGAAPVLTIAKSTVNSDYYSIRINGGDYLTDGTSGLETSSTETQYYWNITYTSNGMQIYYPDWEGGPYYLYFVVYQNTSTNQYGALYATCQEGDFTTSGYNFSYEFPVLYKETTSGGGQEQGLTVYDGTATSGYIPMYGLYFDDYTKSECIIPASELTAMNGATITAITFYPSSVNSRSWAGSEQTVFLKEVSGTTLNGSYSGTSGATTVKVGSPLPMPTANQAYTITFDTPYTYNGGNLLIGVYNDDGTDYNGVYWYGTNNNLSSGVSAYGYNGSSLSSATYNEQKFLPKTTFTYTLPSGYNVNAGTMSNGSIQFSINGGYDWYDELSNVDAGETVVISVQPETGYELQGTPTVTPASGTAPTVSGSGNLYSFVMPESDVTVNATFNCTTPADPTFSVATGTYTSVQNVTISCATAGATVYYTTDGSTPTNSSTQYTGAITINSTTTLKAIAYNGSCTSNVTTATYTMDLPTYTVTCATGLTGGSIAASPASAVEGTTITITATPESGFFLGTITATDGNNNTVAVTVSGNEGTFTMPSSNVTVTATFTQGFNVTLVQTANGTISADQTSNLQPFDHVTLTATPDNDCVFLAWYAYKTGNPRDVVAVISNTTIIMPASDVTVQAVFVTEEEHEQTVGGGTSTGNYLPTNAYYKYSLTQQIYTADEIVYNGRITAIAFKATSTISAPRSLDIYMSHTDKTAFSSTSNWEVMGSVALVFSGSVSFAYNDWTTITLDAPFEYDGTSNLNICVVDKTGSDESGSRSFSTYSTSENRALYKYNDNTNYSTYVGYSNQLESLTGEISTSNNQIVFTIKTPGSAESLTISPDAISDFSYLEGQGPSQTHKLDIVGVDLENNITLTAPTDFEISLTEDGTYASSLTIPREIGSKGSRNVTTWDFEGSFLDWTTLDADGDGYNWIVSTNLMGTGFTNAYSGSDGLTSQSYVNPSSKGALNPDNWLISPQVELGGSFSMWACPQQAAYPAEHFGIYVSTTGTNPSDFTLLDEWTLSSGVWKQFSVDLGLYTGQQGYIAVRHYNCSDQFYINVDYFVLDTDATITIEMPVTITPATVFVRMKDNLSAGTYSGTLTASAGSGTNVNGSVSLSGEVIAAYNITLTANPTEGGAVAGAGTYATGTEVTVSARTNSPYQFINWTENGEVVSTDASYTFTVNGDRDLVANFGFIKHITGYANQTNPGGYNLIASPIGTVAPTQVTNMITPKDGDNNTYDLYRFDQAQALEWRNYRQGAFNLNVGQGYLYAHRTDVDLVFTGSAISSESPYEVTLSKTTAAGDGLEFPDWNLVGNPFAETAYIADGRDFYTMTGDGRSFVVSSVPSIEAMEGVFVIAGTNNEKMYFTTTEPDNNGKSIVLNLGEGRQNIDRAIVRFGEGRTLPKLQFFEGSTKIYIPQDGKDYAVVRSEEMGAMPVNFKAENNGTYSLNVSGQNTEFAYLHLIDNKTGNDVDLLKTPSYSFEAKTTDYESRFKLVFATGDNSNDDSFAFFSNGSFVINNDGAAELQVIDLMGRILSSETINGCTNVNVNAAPGVYMLRLINGDNVKVQKVVVK